LAHAPAAGSCWSPAADCLQKVWAVDTREFSSLTKAIRRDSGCGFETAIDYQGPLEVRKPAVFRPCTHNASDSLRSPFRNMACRSLYRPRQGTAHTLRQNGELSRRAGAFSAVGGLYSAPPPSMTRPSLNFCAPAVWIVHRPQSVAAAVQVLAADRFGRALPHDHKTLLFAASINTDRTKNDLADKSVAASGCRSTALSMAMVRHCAICVMP